MTPKIQDRSTHVPQHVLRRLGPRALQILDRNVAAYPVLASVEARVRSSASAFISAYDNARISGPRQALSFREGREATEALSHTVRNWTGWLERDVDGFDSRAYSNASEVPDDVIANTERLVELVKGYQVAKPDAVPYAEQLLAELDAALIIARKKWSEAQDDAVALQLEQAQVRELAGKLQKNLTALRRTLRNVLGPRHRDYLKLRQSQSTTDDEDDAAGDEVQGGAGASADDNEREAEGDAHEVDAAQ